MAAATAEQTPMYERVVKMVFSGRLVPGERLLEQEFAAELGVSRIPVRETLAKLVGQGLLVGGEKGQGVRMRDYSPDEVHQLYDFRAILEGGAACAAARSATRTDLARLQMICDHAESEAGNYEYYGSERSAELDHRFHAALAEASHNERVSCSLKLLLTECHYLFYLYPPREGRPKPAPEDAITHMENVQRDHRALVELIRSGDADGAERKARADMLKSGERVNRALTKLDLRR